MSKLNPYLATAYTLIVFLMCGCNSDKLDPKKAFIENVEIYSVFEDATGSAKGELLYKESTQYKDTDLPVWRKFYEANGNLKATETYIYKGSGLPAKSEYHDATGTLLSNYIFHNIDGHKRRTVSMEAESDEILRIETFDYNKKGDRIERVIMDGASNVDKTYSFGFDGAGNETSMTVKDANNQELYSYKYTVTKKDTRNRWLESWGFRNNKPDQVKYRTFTSVEEAE
jgi:hypothetical protein